MLRVLHTADWHVGCSFKQFEPDDARKLARDRLSVVDRILGLAHQYDVHAVLCAGDLFDSPDPGEDWWKGLADFFKRRDNNWSRPVVLLPGNHDPLTPQSVYSENHSFRHALPKWVRVVDREGFQLELSDNAVVYAAPCTTTAGDRDLAMALPARAEGDQRVRIGLVHGSTFDMPGYQTNFPVSQEAPQQRGLDYLALGDRHGYREFPEGALAPIVYPSAPEPTRFGEADAGYVALVWFNRHGTRPRIQRERVGRWTWRDETVGSMADLRALATEDLLSTVLRLRLDLNLSLPEKKEVDDILSSLAGNEAVNGLAGVFSYDRKNSNERVAAGDAPPPEALPTVVRETWTKLRDEAGSSEEAQRALVILQRLLHEAE